MEKDFRKDFDTWNGVKKGIQERDSIPFFHEREIWWCSLGLNLGVEQDGKNDDFERPVLILRVFNKDSVWIIPLTSKPKRGKYYYKITHREQTYAINLSQFRLISTKRLSRKIRMISQQDFDTIKGRIKGIL